MACCVQEVPFWPVSSAAALTSNQAEDRRTLATLSVRVASHCK